MQSPETTPRPPYRNTIGSIVTWAIVRAAAVIFAAIVAYDYVKWLDYSLWFSITALSMYAFVLHPIQVQYRIFREETRRVRRDTLCSSCRHFVETSVLCQKLDEHVTEDYIPCDGELWEPRSTTIEDDDDD